MVCNQWKKFLVPGLALTHLLAVLLKNKTSLNLKKAKGHPLASHSQVVEQKTRT
jgi:hypothetical protein